MIGPREVVVGVACGVFALVFGLVPGLFQDLTNGIQNFSDAMRGDPPRPVTTSTQPTGLAIFGAALIALTLTAYLTQ
jgi:hypothetical protein